MRKVVIYPGRYHPFHKGHKGVYDHLVKKYGATNVYIASTDVQDPINRPFSFADKKLMMMAMGVPNSQILEVTQTYNQKEYTGRFNENETVLIFALGGKDAERLGAPKKDGSWGYIMPLQRKLDVMANHAYVDVIPTINFDINGKSYDSASNIRKDYINSDDAGRKAMIQGLFGKFDPRIKSIFDDKLALSESLIQLENAMLGRPLLEGADEILKEYMRILKEVKQLELEAEEDIINESFGDWLLRKLRMRWGQIGDKVSGSVVAKYLERNTYFRGDTLKELASHTYQLKTIDPATAKKYRAFSDQESQFGDILDAGKMEMAAGRKITMDSLIQYPPVVDADGYIWDGNHRVNRAIELGIPQIPILIQVT